MKFFRLALTVGLVLLGLYHLVAVAAGLFVASNRESLLETFGILCFGLTLPMAIVSIWFPRLAGYTLVIGALPPMLSMGGGIFGESANVITRFYLLGPPIVAVAGISFVVIGMYGAQTEGAQVGLEVDSSPNHMRPTFATVMLSKDSTLAMIVRKIQGLFRKN